MQLQGENEVLIKSFTFYGIEYKLHEDDYFSAFLEKEKRAR
jgi:hypothetical protein